MADKLIVDCSTGEQSTAPLTAAETAERQQMATADAAFQQQVVTARTNRSAIEDAARVALTTNRTYIGKASPSAAETTAEVKALARQNNGIIRLLLGLLDGTD